MDTELIIDMRSLFADELAHLLKACDDLIAANPDDERLAGLKEASIKFDKLAQVSAVKPLEKTPD